MNEMTAPVMVNGARIRSGLKAGLAPITNLLSSIFLLIRPTALTVSTLPVGSI
ncbi:MAG: hypothetical protein JSV44_12050 [Candidatus Zixiibacteriota bacterium]|nr:MAG: hypothetical protein JSV44_12050 [candidate division Zixibacteria bacterium]